MQRIRSRGLTLIEILIALSLLGIMTGFVVSSLAGSFQITRASQRTLEATAAVQRVLEEVRGQWQNRTLYDSSCAVIDLSPAASTFLTLTATRLDLTSSASASTGATPMNITTAGCPTAPPTPGSTCPATQRMQRVVITALDNTDSNRTLASASLDIVCLVVP